MQKNIRPSKTEKMTGKNLAAPLVSNDLISGKISSFFHLMNYFGMFPQSDKNLSSPISVSGWRISWAITL